MITENAPNYEYELVTVNDSLNLLKRLISDVKFEAIQLEAHNSLPEGAQDLPVIVGNQSDLLKGVYEGGFKTWECSLDLVGYLAEHLDLVTNKRVMELGCGSGLPGIFALSQGSNYVVFQDYNDYVLRFWTVPNLILNSEAEVREEAKNGTFESEVNLTRLASLPVDFWAGDWEV